MEFIRSKYKVTCVLYAEEDFAALQAVDIESREKREYLLNVYEGALGRHYVGIFDQLRGCPEFVELFLDRGALVVVFECVPGGDIDSMFYRGADVPWQDRLDYAQELFHLALRVCSYPPEIACAAFLSRNLKVLPRERRFGAQYLVWPMGELNQRELIFLLSDQLEKIFLRRFSSTNAELRLLDALAETTREVTVPVLYADWLTRKEGIRAECEKIAAKPIIIRQIYLLGMNLKRWSKRVFARKR